MQVTMNEQWLKKVKKICNVLRNFVMCTINSKQALMNSQYQREDIIRHQ